MHTVLLPLFTIFFYNFSFSSEAFVDPNCLNYIKKNKLVSGTMKKGRGIDRTYRWSGIREEYSKKANYLKSEIEKSKGLEFISEGKKWCQSYPDPPTDCPYFQSYCVRELKNKGLIDLFEAWNLRLDECIKNPTIRHPRTGKKVSYLSVWGENCEFEKVRANLNEVRRIKNDFDKIAKDLPPEVAQLWLDLEDKYVAYQKDQKLRKAEIEKEKKKNKREKAKKSVNNILAKCQDEFELGLAGVRCKKDEEEITTSLGGFKESIEEIKDLTDATRIVADVADTDVLKGVYARLYLGLMDGEIKSRNPNELEKALCSVNTKAVKENICTGKYRKQRRELIQSFLRDVNQAPLAQQGGVSNLIEKETNNINSTLRELNSICKRLEQTQKSRKGILQTVAFSKTDFGAMRSVSKGVNEFCQLGEEKENFQKQALRIYQEKLIKNSKFPGILGTETLKRMRLSETVSNCDIPEVSKGDVRKALIESKEIAFNSVNENLNHRAQGIEQQNKKRLLDIVRTDPQGVYESLLRLEDPGLAAIVCRMMKDKKDWDRNVAIGKSIALGALVVASLVPGAVVITGPLASGLAVTSNALALGLSGVTIAQSTGDYLQGKSDEKAYMNKGLMNANFCYQEIDGAERLQETAVKNAAFEIAQTWGTLGVGKVLGRTMKGTLSQGRNKVIQFFNKASLPEKKIKTFNKLFKNNKAKEYIDILVSRMSRGEVKRFFKGLDTFQGDANNFVSFVDSLQIEKIKNQEDFFNEMAVYVHNGEELESISAKSSERLERYNLEGHKENL